MDCAKEHINVCVRIKPFLTFKQSVEVISDCPPVLLVPERSQTYQFDKIFGQNCDQAFVYDNAVKPYVELIKEGFSCTVFTYGQTGTGKTYTMGSALQACQNPGIIPRALDQLFDKECEDLEVEISISFLEIYNEKVFDLLQPDRVVPLAVSGFMVHGLSTKNVKNASDAKQLLEEGNKNRHIGETKQNSGSSRSHAVFTVHYTMRNSMQEITGKLNLVDLAGSESVRKTGSQGSTFHEGVNINKGLLSIGQVISALGGKANYIPYRQSMITSILQGSLNKENYISLIACISANPEDLTETVQTLDFAKRVKLIRCNPEVVAKYKKDNPQAFNSGRTPLKRVSSNAGKTPAHKRACLSTLPLINESAQSQSANNRENSRSQSSIDTFSSNEPNLSPVIRKYMAKMEVNLINHMETVVQNTLRRSRRLTRTGGEPDKENTPKLLWSKIQTEMTQMIRSEIAQLTEIKPVRATSSPIESRDKLTARRHLCYDSPDDSNNTAKTDFPFKVPALPKSNNLSKQQSKLSPQVSPIETELPKITPRRSLRLKIPNYVNSTVNVSFESHQDRNPNVAPQRRSVRLSIKNTRSNDVQLNDSDDFVQPRKRMSHKDSPFTANSKRVLKILNQGSQKDLERLHTVGTKTAEQILLFRRLKGAFEDINSLAKVPGWGTKKLLRFNSANFLNRD